MVVEVMCSAVCRFIWCEFCISKTTHLKSFGIFVQRIRGTGGLRILSPSYAVSPSIEAFRRDWACSIILS
jgi:hypothetical protein